MWPIRSLRYMRIAGSLTSRLNGWSMPTNSGTPDYLRSKEIRCSKTCVAPRDTPNFSSECACRHRGALRSRPPVTLGLLPMRGHSLAELDMGGSSFYQG